MKSIKAFIVLAMLAITTSFAHAGTALPPHVVDEHDCICSYAFSYRAFIQLDRDGDGIYDFEIFIGCHGEIWDRELCMIGALPETGGGWHFGDTEFIQNSGGIYVGYVPILGSDNSELCRVMYNGTDDPSTSCGSGGLQ